jgi:hypothetical protein
MILASGCGTNTEPAAKDETNRSGNPIITSIFTADPSAHVWPDDDGRLYLYPSQDVFPAVGCNLMDKYHVFSTDNIVDWVDHGEILRRDDLPVDEWGPHHEDATFMWAPDAAYNDKHPEGKGPYFFIFPHSTGGDTDGPEGWGSQWKVGIAHSDSPFGGFKDNEIAFLKDKDGSVISGGGIYIDPCVFQDGGDYYLVIGGGGECRVAKLAPDMETLAEDFTVFKKSVLPYYHEGPWMFTRVNDAGVKIYYLMYPGNVGGSGDDMLYATSEDGPYGPWTYRGSILKPTGTGDTSHGSIVEFKGHWYLFYHNAALSGGAGNLRSVCVDELFFNADGMITPVEQTEAGAAAIGPAADTAALDRKYGEGSYRLEARMSAGGEESYAGYTPYRTYGVMDDACIVAEAQKQENTQAVHNMHLSGAYCEFTGVSGGESGGRVLLEVDYGAQEGAALLVTVNGEDKYFLRSPSTGGWETFTGKARCLIDLQPGGGNTVRLSNGAINIRSITILTEPDN